MPKASGKKPTIANAEADSFESFLDQDDFKDFLRIATVTGSVPDDALTNLDKDKLVDQYKAWVNDGKPKPQMPTLKTSVEEILRIYRRKAGGKQYLSYVVKGKSEQVGMETIISYAKSPDGSDDTSLIIGRDRRPVLEYTDKLAKELISKAKRYNPDTFQLRFVYQTATIVVNNEENFTGDFDKLMTKAMNKELI